MPTPEPRDLKLVIHVSEREKAAIEDYQFRNRITNRSEAARALIASALAQETGK